MKQRLLVLEFAGLQEGQVRRVRLGYPVLSCCLVAVAVLFGGYVSLARKAAAYDRARTEVDALRTRYQELASVTAQRNEQLVSLQTLASEVKVSYGLAGPPSAWNSETAVDGFDPTVKESLKNYNFLKAATLSGIYHRYAYRWERDSQPSLWPVNGLLRSSFGGRSDPFSGEGAFHTGVDLEAVSGTPVHVTADGVVTSAGWSGAYGKLVVVDHGNGLETYYAHLSECDVVVGQAVRKGQVIALSGGTGRATGPHMHYEVRVHGTPVNPYRYLAKAAPATITGAPHSDLGL